MKAGQAKALIGKPRQIRRVDFAAVRSRVAESQIIGHDDEKIGFLRRCHGCRVAVVCRLNQFVNYGTRRAVVIATIRYSDFLAWYDDLDLPKYLKQILSLTAWYLILNRATRLALVPQIHPDSRPTSASGGWRECGVKEGDDKEVEPNNDPSVEPRSGEGQSGLHPPETAAGLNWNGFYIQYLHDFTVPKQHKFNCYYGDSQRLKQPSRRVHMDDAIYFPDYEHQRVQLWV